MSLLSHAVRIAHAAANGLEVQYVDAGDPAHVDVLVLLHGGTETALERWASIIPLLAHRCRVIAPDSRGHGGTADDGRSLSYSLLADDAEALCQALGIGRAWWCGFSDGANVILDLAIRRSPVLRAGVLHGCVVDFTPSYLEAIQAFLATVPEDAARTVELLWTTPFTYGDSDYAGVSAPLLVLTGARDEFATVGDQAALHRRLPGSELLVLPESGHDLPADRGGYTATILDFLERRGR
jgi:pimeloyl-ACP methyl ester carboxylesterase